MRGTGVRQLYENASKEKKLYVTLYRRRRSRKRRTYERGCACDMIHVRDKQLLVYLASKHHTGVDTAVRVACAS